MRPLFTILSFFCISTALSQTVEKDFSQQPVGRSGLFKTVSFYGKKYFVCEVDPRVYSIEVLNRIAGTDQTHDFNTIATAKKDKLLFAMNGGMYQEDLSAVGLLVADGKLLKRLNQRKDAKGNFYLMPNGVFLIDSSAKAHVVTTETYAAKKYRVKLATQSGPMLVVDGKINNQFTQGSQNLNIRNGVGVNKQGHVVCVVSENGVNFYELAELFRDQFGCNNALYLDGFVSQYYAPELQQSPKPGFRLGIFLTVSKR